MTVCIGGICSARTEPRIVLCSERRLEDETSGSDVGLKWYPAGKGFWALISGGDFGLGLEQAEVIKRHIDSVAIQSRSIAEELRICAATLKRRALDEFTMDRQGLTYQYILDEGTKKLPRDIHRNILYDAQKIGIKNDFLIAGFIGDEPHLLLMDRCGVVRQSEVFASVGSGAPIAMAALRQRGFKSSMSVDEAIYYIWEAKRLSEIAPGVGRKTDIGILIPGDLRLPSPFVIPELDEAYKRFGLQKFVCPESFRVVFPETKSAL